MTWGPKILTMTKVDEPFGPDFVSLPNLVAQVIDHLL
jgi:hypothetical protein